MSWGQMPWRDEVEERRKAEQVARNTREAIRAAKYSQPSNQEFDEDENGFVDLPSYRIPGMVWSPDRADDEGQPRLSWLHGPRSA